MIVCVLCLGRGFSETMERLQHMKREPTSRSYKSETPGFGK